MPETVFDLYREFLERERPEAIRERIDGGFRPLSTAELSLEARRLTAALVDELGLPEGGRVGLLAANGRHPFLIEAATLAAGGVLLPLVPEVSADEILTRARSADVRVLFVEGLELFSALAGRAAELPEGCYLVRLDGPAGNTGLITHLVPLLENHFVAPGWDELVRPRGADDPAIVLATRDAAGEPAEVVHDHRSLLAAAAAAGNALPKIPVGGGTVLISQSLALPFPRALYYHALRQSLTVAFPESPETVGRDLVQCRPDLLVGSFETAKSVMNRIYDIVRTNPPLRQRLFRWGVAQGRKSLPARLAGRRPGGLKQAIAERAVFAPIRQILGGRLKLIVTSGQPVTHGWLTFFWGAGVAVCEGYGRAEAPVVALGAPGSVRLETVGRPVPGVEVRRAEDGEILLRGEGVAASQEDSADAWLATGDVGRLDVDGFLHLEGKTGENVEHGGETISPWRLGAFLGASHFVRHAAVAARPGEAPVALLEPDFARLETVVRVHGIDASNRDELIENPRIRRIFAAELKSFESLLPKPVHPRAFDLVPDVWSVASGELRPDGTVRRDAVLARYADRIDKLFGA